MAWLLPLGDWPAGNSQMPCLWHRPHLQLGSRGRAWSLSRGHVSCVSAGAVRLPSATIRRVFACFMPHVSIEYLLCARPVPAWSPASSPHHASRRPLWGAAAFPTGEETEARGIELAGTHDGSRSQGSSAAAAVGGFSPGGARQLTPRCRFQQGRACPTTPDAELGSWASGSERGGRGMDTAGRQQWPWGPCAWHGSCGNPVVDFADFELSSSLRAPHLTPRHLMAQKLL